MDLSLIKSKFKDKANNDIKDLDLALDAVPFLVREIDRLNDEIKKVAKMYNHLVSLKDKRPPLEKKGKRGSAEWEVFVNEEKKRVFIKLVGKFDSIAAKAASNSIITIFTNIASKVDVINDTSMLNQQIDKRALFHMNKIFYNLEMLKVPKLVNIMQTDTSNLSILLTSKMKKAGCIIYTTDTIEKAEVILDQ